MERFSKKGGGEKSKVARGGGRRWGKGAKKRGLGSDCPAEGGGGGVRYREVCRLVSGRVVCWFSGILGGKREEYNSERGVFGKVEERNRRRSVGTDEV